MSTSKTKCFIVSFTNGIAKKDAEKQLEFSYDKESGIKVNAKGVQFVSEEIQNPYTTHFCCEVDEETNEVKWKPAEMLLMSLKPKIKEEKTQEIQDTYLEKSVRLAEEFGTTKMKRDARIRKKQFENSAAAATAIEQNFNSLHIQTPQPPSEDDAVDDNMYNVIPPKNPNAQSLLEVFNIYDIIPENLFPRLSKLSDDFITYCEDSIVKKDPQFPEYIAHIYSILKHNEDHEVRDKKIVLLLYWYYLHTFNNVLSRCKLWKQARHNESLMNLPTTIRKFLKSQFIISKSFPPAMKTKCTCYLLILSLFISDFDMDCLPLIKDLQLKLSKMKTILKAIGCTISHNFQRTSRKRKSTSETVRNEEVANSNFSAQLVLKS